MWSGMWSNIANALSSIPSGVSASCTPFMSSGSSIIELIWVFLGARHRAWKCPSLPQLKHVRGHGCRHEGFSTCAALLRICPCLGAYARLLVSIGTGMLRIHGGAFDELTCRGAKPWVCWFPWGNCGWLFLWKGLKSGAFCAIEFTSCIDLTMATIRFFMVS